MSMAFLWINHNLMGITKSPFSIKWNGHTLRTNKHTAFNIFLYSNMEEKRNIDQLQAVWLAAGVLAVMAASLERAAVVYTIVKQWRSWVFVVLNILLLAILFTSKHSALSSNSSDDDKDDNCHQENNIDSRTEKMKKRVRKQPPCRMVVVVEDANKDCCDHRCKVTKRSEKMEEKEKIIRCDDGGGGNGKSTPLSNEELNERVEAFIATFRRQHLVSDHVKGRSTSGIYTCPAKNEDDILSKSILV